MRLALTLAAVLLVAVPAARAKEPRCKAGQAYERVTAGGVKYAVYLPSRWKRGKPLPVMVRVTNLRQLPIDFFRHHEVRGHLERYDGGKGVIGCGVLLKAHNQENPQWKGRVDNARYVRLLERDVDALDTVLADLEREFVIESDAVALFGMDYAAEVVLGIGLRRPRRFMTLIVQNLRTGTLRSLGPRVHWDALPKKNDLAAALDLPILIDMRYDATTWKVIRKQNREFRDALGSLGFRRLRLVEPDENQASPPRVNPEQFTAYDELLASTRSRRAHRKQRDRHLAAARKALDRKNLDAALKAYRKAVSAESAHGLKVESKPLYELLEAEARRRLEAIAALPESKRRAARKKLRRIFEGLPLARELD